MHFDPSKGTALPSAPSSTLKRTLSQQATARKIPRVDGAQSPARSSSTVFSPDFNMPGSSSTSSSRGNSNASSSRGAYFGRATRAAPPAFQAGKRKGKGKSHSSKSSTIFDGPLHDKSHVESHFAQTYPNASTPKSVHLDNPKSSVSNFQHTVCGTLPNYECKEGLLNGRLIWRCVASQKFQYQPCLNLLRRATVMVLTQVDAAPEVVAIGDKSVRKEAEKLAALAAIYELHGRGMVCGLRLRY